MSRKAYRYVTLLLNRNVEGLGIVGDVVKVKPGFARNYLLPLGIAEPPTDERIEALKEARELAQAEVERIRALRTGIIEAMVELSMELTRSCNDRGILYGSVTQRDISDGLRQLGHEVDERAIRLSQPIRRLGEFSVAVQFDKDLKADISVKVLPDRSLAEEMDEMEFDNEGNLIDKTQGGRGKRREEDNEGQDDSSDEGGSEEATAENEAAEPVEASADNG